MSAEMEKKKQKKEMICMGRQDLRAEWTII